MLSFLAFLLLLTSFIGSYILSQKIRRPIVVFILSFFYLILSAVFIALEFFPAIRFKILYLLFYGLLLNWVQLIPCFYFGGLICKRINNRITRGAIKLFLLVTFIQFIYSQYDVYSLHIARYAENPVGKYCLQTTHYTCGSAAACTILNHAGIKTSEKEMTKLCHTGIFTGTNQYLISDCLMNKFTAENIAKACAPRAISFNEIKSTKMPFAAVLQFPFFSHWVVVLSANNNRVVLFDPRWGIENISYPELQNIWKGVAVVCLDE